MQRVKERKRQKEELEARMLSERATQFCSHRSPSQEHSMAPQCFLNKNNALTPTPECVSGSAKLSENRLLPNVHALAPLRLLTGSLHLDAPPLH